MFAYLLAVGLVLVVEFPWVILFWILNKNGNRSIKLVLKTFIFAFFTGVIATFLQFGLINYFDLQFTLYNSLILLSLYSLFIIAIPEEMAKYIPVKNFAFFHFKNPFDAVFYGVVSAVGVNLAKNLYITIGLASDISQLKKHIFILVLYLFVNSTKQVFLTLIWATELGFSLVDRNREKYLTYVFLFAFFLHAILDAILFKGVYLLLIIILLVSAIILFINLFELYKISKKIKN